MTIRNEARKVTVRMSLAATIVAAVDIDRRQIMLFSGSCGVTGTVLFAVGIALCIDDSVAQVAASQPGRSVIIEAVVTGTLYETYDDTNFLGYGGSTLADGHRATVRFTWKVDEAPLPQISGGYYDYWTNGTFPATVPVSWVRSSIALDNGMTLSSSDYAGTLQTTDQVKIGDQVYGDGWPLPSPFDYYGIYDDIDDQNPEDHSLVNEYRVSAVVYETNQKFVSGFGIDQQLNWRPKSRTESYTAGYFNIRRSYTVNPDGSTTLTSVRAGGRLAIDSLKIHRKRGHR